MSCTVITTVNRIRVTGTYSEYYAVHNEPNGAQLVVGISLQCDRSRRNSPKRRDLLPPDIGVLWAAV